METQEINGENIIVLLDKEDYAWAVEWVNKSYTLQYPLTSMRAKVRRAIVEYVIITTMLNEILGTWK